MKTSVIYPILILVLLLGCFGFVCAEDSSADPLSQINDLDAYIQNWEKNYEEELKAAGISPEEAAQYGYRPNPLEDLFPEAQTSVMGRLTAESLPESYNLQDYGWLSSVKNQGSYGTCWAFSVINSIESSILKQNLAPDVDLSERHLAYFTYNRGNDPLGNLTKDTAEAVGSTYYANGFNNAFTPFILSSWTGPVLESKAPYDESPWTNLAASLQYGDDAYHVKNIYRLSITSDQDGVKSAIRAYGAGVISYLTYGNYYQSGTYNGAGYTSYYYPYATDATNHSVSVVGWDDNFPKENFKNAPASDGAWLIQQSWGDDWGSQNGYFWLSYADNSLDDNVYFYETEAVDKHSRSYQYDGSAGNYFVWNDKMANIFTAQNDETISSVSFGTPDSIIEYTVKVYTGCTATNPESGTLAATMSGITENEYIKTIDLTKDVSVSKGQRFSVVVDLGGEYSGHYLVDSTEDFSWVLFTSYGCPKQSFYYYSGTWNDMNDSCGSDAVVARIKAFTAGTPVSGLKASLSEQTAALSWTALSGAQSYEIYRSASADTGFTKIGTAAGTSFSATSLGYGSTWYFKVRAVLDSSGKYSDYSNSVKVSTSTPAVSGLKATVSGQTAALSWTALSGAQSYEIYRSTAASSGFTKIGTATSTSYSASGLAYGTTYYFKVRALFSNGVYSNYSNVVNATTVVPTLFGLKATVSGQTVKLSWTALSNVKSYLVYSSTSASSGFTKTATVTGTGCSVSGLEYGTTYYFKARALFNTGTYSNYSTVVQATIPNPAVTGLKATVSGQTVKLSWTALADAQTYYIYSSQSATSDFTKLGTSTKTSSSASGLIYGTTYYFKVRAKFTNGKYSNYSDVVKASIANIAVSGLKASVSGQTVKLSWSSLSNVKSYKVYGSTTSASDGFELLTTTSKTSCSASSLIHGTTYYFKVRALFTNGKYSSYSAVVKASIANTAVSGLKATVSGQSVKLSWTALPNVKSYKVYYSLSSSSGFSKLGTATGKSCSASGLINGTTYYFKVRALFTNGVYSKYSAVVKASIANTAVSGLKASVSSQTAKLTWTALSNVKTYIIYRSTSSSSGFTKIGTASGTSYTASSLDYGTTYYFKVRAKFTNGVYSNYSSAVKAAVANVSVTGLKASVSGQTAKLSWTALSGVKSYEVYRSTSKSSGFAKVGTTTGVSCSIKKLSYGTTYYFKVRALFTNGKYSNYSSALKTVIPAAKTAEEPVEYRETAPEDSFYAYAVEEMLPPYEVSDDNSLPFLEAKENETLPAVEEEDAETVLFSEAEEDETLLTDEEEDDETALVFEAEEDETLLTDEEEDDETALVFEAEESEILPSGDSADVSDSDSSIAFFWLSRNFLDDPNRPEMPATGFPTGHFTPLPSISASSVTPTGVTLRIPTLNLNAEVDALGLDEQTMNYDVSRLNNHLGCLEGTTLPGQGFSVLVGHNHLNTMEAGPFANLHEMEVNDRLFVTNAADQMTGYSVYANLLIEADDYSTLAENIREDALLLITCEDETTAGTYLHRRVIFAEPLG